jgi:hypothetical protein
VMATANTISPFTYLDSGLTVVLILPRSKRPLPHPVTDSWWPVSDPSELDRVLRQHPQVNIALLCEDVVQVDMDSPESIDWAVARGLRREGAWVVQTSRGYRLFYREPADCPTTHTDPTHRMPDFLGPRRLALVPPSVHPDGHAYRWASGNSPLHIPPESLAPVPSGILEEWRRIARITGSVRPRADAPSWVGLVFDAICGHLEDLGHILRPVKGGGVVTTCPMHDDREPSLSMHPERGWRCWAGCGEGKLTQLAARLGIRVPEVDQ